MKYSLIIYKNLDVFEIEGFSEIASGDINEHSLEDIVSFTSEYESEEDLVETLGICGLIPKEFVDGEFGIYKYPGKDKKPTILPYGISFKQDKQFYNPDYLKNYYLDQMTNPKFMKIFLGKYCNYLRKVPVFYNDLARINEGFEIYQNTGYFSAEYKDNMRSFINNYTRAKKTDGTYKIAFIKLRELAMFAIDHENAYNRVKPKNKFKDTSYFESLRLELEKYKELLKNIDENDDDQYYYMYMINSLEEELKLERKV